ASKGMLTPVATTVLEKGVEGVYHLDPTKSPKQIDFTTLGEFRKTGLGIYSLEGDTLKLCLSIDPEKVDQRPTEFATKPGEMGLISTSKGLPPTVVAPKPGQDKLATAMKAADAWLKLIDEGKYGEAWEQFDSGAKQRTPKEDFVRAYEKKAQELGKRK